MSEENRAAPAGAGAKPPEPPFWAAIFSSRRTAPDPEYDEAAARMVELASTQPGFLGIESARSEDGTGITVSYWETREAIAAWKAHVEHREIQFRGRRDWYERYTVRIARVERAYTFEKS
jgi:heme-degrading monooxygenase HmoA